MEGARRCVEDGEMVKWMKGHSGLFTSVRESLSEHALTRLRDKAARDAVGSVMASFISESVSEHVLTTSRDKAVLDAVGSVVAFFIGRILWAVR